MNGALAMFAKTPGLSPVKTRLAADIGTASAETFYRLSVEATEEVAAAAHILSKGMLTPYWSVAEQEALRHPHWQRFRSMWTGEGGLGQRLHTVYHTLGKTHDYVIMIGTDSPQLEPALLLDAAKKLEVNPTGCIVGPCPDGGFYLFAGAIALPESLWTGIAYSAESTTKELIQQLESLGVPVTLLPMQVDVDTIHDIKAWVIAMSSASHPLPAQKRLLRWLMQ